MREISNDELVAVSGGAPVFGSNGQLTARQGQYAQAAYAARQHMTSELKLSSNSGAVESRQWRSMVNAAQGQ